MIFDTERLRVRELIFDDVHVFHEMQSNPNVMQFATGDVKNIEAHKVEILELISKYDLPENDFWIYAIVSKIDAEFVGTVAFVKDKNDDEIGYRFLEKHWGNGYATEMCEAVIDYCRKKEMPKIVGYVVDANIASAKILKRFNFKPVKQFISEDIQLPETKYELFL